jgi:hypothetical protein
MALIHLARQGFITKSALPSITRTRGAPYQPSLLILGEGTNGSTSITDSSQNAFVPTINGNTSISTTQKPTGMTSSIYFDGNGDYLTFSSSLFDFTSTYTWEAWIYQTSRNSTDGNGLFFTSSGGITSDSNSLQFAVNGAGKLLYYAQNAVGQNTTVAGAITIALNTWTHVAIVRNSNTVTIFVNGVADGSASTSINPLSNDIHFGFYRSSGQLQYFPGYMSNIRVVKGTALYTKNFVPPILPLSTTQASTVYPDLLLLGNGTNGSTTITDSSPNAFTITRNGDTNISTAQYPVGMTSSIYFDGTGDYLTVANNAVFDFGTGDFTIECWFYIAGNSATNNDGLRTAILLGTFPASGTITGYALAIVGDATTTGTGLRFSNYVSSTGYDINYTATISQNTWHHFAAVRSGTTTTIYLNGASVASGTLGNQNVNAGSNALSIGRLGYTGYIQEFNGYISNVRITKGVARYTQKFNVPLPPLPSSSVSIGASPSLYITGNGINNSTNIIDSSSNAFTITRNGDVKISTTTAPTGMVSSVYFDGTGDYLTVGTTSSFNWLHNSSALFTIEVWIYVPTLIELFIFGTNSGSSSEIGTAFWVNSSGQLRLLIGKGVGAQAVIDATSSGAITVGSWAHIAVTYDQSLASTNCVFYINGQSSGTANKTANAPSSSSSAYPGTVHAFGTYAPGACYMSNLRVTNKVLYTATFVPPPLPLLSNFNYISYPSLLLRGAGTNGSTTFTDSSPNAFTVTAFGNAQISTAQYPTGMSSSMVFDGNGDYLEVADNAAWQFGSGDFSVDGMLYLSSLPTSGNYYAVVGYYHSSSPYWEIFVRNTSGTVALEINGTVYANFDFAISTWYHFAVVRISGVVYMYINGNLINSGSLTDNVGSLSLPLRVGVIRSTASGSYLGYFNGYLSNIRIIKGTALYRSNFTPPVLPASATPQTNLTASTPASTVTNSVYGVYQLA